MENGEEEATEEEEAMFLKLPAFVLCRIFSFLPAEHAIGVVPQCCQKFAALPATPAWWMSRIEAEWGPSDMALYYAHVKVERLEAPDGTLDLTAVWKERYRWFRFFLPKVPTFVRVVMRDPRATRLPFYEESTLTDDLIRPLVDTLREPASHLRQLSLRQQSLVSEPVLIRLADALHVNRTLQSLDLSYIALGDGALQALAAALAVNRGLDSLCLEKCGLRTECGLQLAHALLHNRSLRRLELARNLLGAEAAVALARALHTNWKLELCDLRDNLVLDADKKNPIFEMTHRDIAFFV